MLMPDDASGSNEEELASQIDELRARMDRLMTGGTSTSNSALVTDSPKQTSQTVIARPASAPPPERSRVRDLIGPSDRELLEGYADAEEVVAFPDDDGTEKASPESRPAEDRPSPPAPNDRPRAVAVDGSLISVGKGRDDAPRPRVTSFDDLGSAVAEELARDSSVPPVEPKKGPGLASRFGRADEPVASVAEPMREPAADEDAAEPEVAAILAVDESEASPAAPSRRSALVAIWGFAAVTSGTIAVLHMTGLI
jgi:hypothetical protein